MPTLYIIRHARADERGAKYPDDTKRPLVAKGVRQVKSLAALLGNLDVMFDRLYSSPYTRAAQTAEPLGTRLKAASIDYLDALAGDDYDVLLSQLQGETLAIVGHEPYLSELVAYLLTGKVDGVAIEVRKAAMLVLSGPLVAGHMTLNAVVPARLYKRFQA